MTGSRGRDVVRVAWFCFAATFSRRKGDYLTVVLLVGLLGGLAMASIAGARRTDSSFPVYLASTNPQTTAVFTGFLDPSLGLSSGYNPGLDVKISHLPLVVAAPVSVGFDGTVNLDGVTGIHPHALPGEEPPTIVGGLDGEYSTHDRVTLVAGRMLRPNDVDAAVVNTQAAAEMGVRVGSVVGVPFYTDAETESSTYNGPPHLFAKIRIVGEIVTSDQVVEDDIAALGSSTIILSSALTGKLASCCAYYSGVALKLAGGEANVNQVHSEITALTPLASLGIGGNTSPGTVLAEAQQSIKPEAIALGAFGAISGLAAVLIVGQVIGRVLRRGATGARTLRALGADRLMTQSDALVGLCISVLLGAVLAATIAVALSPLMPIGPVRPVYPYRGISFDWTVLGFGLLALIIVIGSLVAGFAQREISRLTADSRDNAWKAEPGLVHVATNSALPVSMATGVRFALDPGSGSSDAPVRSAILGAVLALAVLVTTVTFGASLDSLVSHPDLYGWNWNYAMLSGFGGEEDLPGPQTAKLLNDDHAIAAWSGANFIAAKLNGQEVQMMTERPGARVQPPVLAGHGLEAPNQVVLGPMTLSVLHTRVGDTVTLSDTHTKSIHLLIVGTATMPTISKGLQMGSGALVATSDFSVALLNAQQNLIPGPNAVLVRTKDGATPAAALASLQVVDNKINAIKSDGESAGGIIQVLRPAEIVNYHSMGTTPAILGGCLAAGAVIALALTLSASVRRRRHELAILKTLGFTGRQLSSAVAWQSSVAVAVGVLIGVPVGIVLGRVLWTLFARGINAVPQPSVPTLTIVLISIGALALANVVALLPGRYAASTPTVLVLRAE